MITVSGCGRPPQDTTETLPTGASAAQTNEAISAQAAESIFANLPDRLTEESGLLQIDAAVLYPRQISLPIASYAVNYGGAQCAIESLQNEWMPEAAVQDTQIDADEQNGAKQDAQLVSRKDSTGNVLTGEILAYQGRFTLWMDLPETCFSETIDGAAGMTDFSGIARQCGKSADECKEMAQHILETIDLNLSFGDVRSYAVSPAEEGRYVVGYYVTYIPQMIQDVPVSVIQNCGASSSMAIAKTAVSPTGFRMRIFDDGVEDATGFWLDEQNLSPVDTYDALLSLDNALEILKAWVLENYESKTMTVREIRFEYAMIERNGQLTLVPAWSFDTLQGVPNDRFDGVQIDAVNGEVLRVIEEFWL